MDDAGVERADREHGGTDDPVLRIEQQDPELLHRPVAELRQPGVFRGVEQVHHDLEVKVRGPPAVHPGTALRNGPALQAALQQADS